ncbi:MAG: NnrU family protein [Hyphomicrobiales bacterium]
MWEFTAALVTFVMSHSVPAIPRVRARLVASVGETPYRIAYGLVSILLLAWLITATGRSPYIALWAPEPWHAAIALVGMPVSLALIGAAALTPNPLSINLRAVEYDPARPGVVAITRHPMLWGLALWAFSHLFANGDLVSVILFGGLGLFAVRGMLVFDRRMHRKLGGETWQRLAGNTSVLPFAAIVAGRARLAADGRMVLGALLGLGVYVWMLFQGHDLLIGADPLAWF